MRKVFQAELQQVGTELTQIAHLVQDALTQASDSFLNADIDKAEEVISNDQRIDFLQNQLDERCIDILALQGPVASDLRAIVSSLRMSSSLERMGDLARHIAQIARMRYPEKAIPDDVTSLFTEMTELDTRIIDSVIQLLDTRKLDLTEEIYTHKARINSIHREFFTLMNSPEWTFSAQVTVDVTLASRYLERFGDHGVSVARKVNYLVTGEWS